MPTASVGFRSRKTLALCLLIGGCCTVLASSGAASPVAVPGTALASVPAGVTARFRLQEKLLAQGADARTVGDALYWPEVIITGEGGKTQHGRAEMLAAMPETLVAVGHDCKFVPQNAVVSGNIASVFSWDYCSYPDKPQAIYRVLYVFERRGREWKVIQESYTAEVK